MAYEDPGKNITREAASDLSASQYCFVDLNNAGRVALVADGGQAIGVLQNDPDALGRAACVMISGITKVKVGGALTAGDDVASDSSGRAVTPATGDRILGRVLETATAANQIVAMLLQPLSDNIL